MLHSFALYDKAQTSDPVQTQTTLSLEGSNLIFLCNIPPHAALPYDLSLEGSNLLFLSNIPPQAALP